MMETSVHSVAPSPHCPVSDSPNMRQLPRHLTVHVASSNSISNSNSDPSPKDSFKDPVKESSTESSKESSEESSKDSLEESFSCANLRQTSSPSAWTPASDASFSDKHRSHSVASGLSSPTSVTEFTHLLESCSFHSPPTPHHRPEPVLNPDLLTEAARILGTNDLGGYTVPTKGLYPYQWNWDSALVAMGWAAVDEARAWKEVTTLMSAQWEDGMVPHIVFHQHSQSYFPGPEIWGSVKHPRGSTGITQPPVAAISVRKLLEGAVDCQLAHSQASALFPKLMAAHRWFYSARDPEQSGLVATLHPWESGMDNSPAWDEPLSRVPVDAIPPYTRCDLGHVDASMRPKQAEYDRYLTLVYRFRALDYDPGQLYHISPFRVTDLCTNSVLQRANEDLAWLARRLGRVEEVAEIEAWVAKGKAGFAGLWDESSGIFKSKNQITGELLPAATCAGFLPLFAGSATPRQAAVLAKTITRWMDAVQFGVPSLDPFDPKFEPLRYWRGPVWVICNYMITDGLRRYGYAELADRIRDNTVELLNEHGLYEYFDPTTGRGAGGPSFSWTASMCLGWLGGRG